MTSTELVPPSFPMTSTPRRHTKRLVWSVASLVGRPTLAAHHLQGRAALSFLFLCTTNWCQQLCKIVWVACARKYFPFDVSKLPDCSGSAIQCILRPSAVARHVLSLICDVGLVFTTRAPLAIEMTARPWGFTYLLREQARRPPVQDLTGEDPDHPWVQPSSTFDHDHFAREVRQ